MAPTTRNGKKADRNHQTAEEEKYDSEDENFLLKVIAERYQTPADNTEARQVDTGIGAVEDGAKALRKNPDHHSVPVGNMVPTKLDGPEKAQGSKEESASTEGVAEESLPGAHAVGGLQEEDGEESSSALSRNESCDEPINDAFLVDPSVADVADVESGAMDLETEEVFHGQVMPEPPVKNNGAAVCSIALVVVVAVVVVLLVFTLSPSKGEMGQATNSSGSNNNPEETDSVLYPPFDEGLPQDIAKKIQEVGSACYKANLWMLQDPRLQSYSLERKNQRFSMVWMYFVSNGHNWTQYDHWLSYNVSECEWFSQKSSLSIQGWHEGKEPEKVCDQDDNVLVMNLSSNNLQGYVPNPIPAGSMFNRIFDLSDNGLSGNLPIINAQQTFMEILSISNNKFDGFIQSKGSFSLSNLRVVKMDGNTLYGGTEDVYYFLPKLEFIDQTGNPYNARLAHTFHNCKNLTHLKIGATGSYGPIPTEMGLVTSLHELDLSANPLINGTVPASLGNLTALTKLDIRGTAVTGSLPDELCHRVKEGVLEILANCSRVLCCNASE
ncbi:Leucine Rich Repeat [Seminavis robusta]|uniref:Leucine Rich Repeat n=1 Tax=Seminavis robusta TaxID=568900 RepID=A0A9N8HTM3_9STRA|nr:Leucine Rich Repeat [Seminavis robusta]|eukprot:Sro1291_g259880.1 Leucine Rich Repeat (553) ;mRNA; f:6561-8219